MLRDLRPSSPARSRPGFFSKKKGNRRVRTTESGSQPLLPPAEPRPRIWGRIVLCAVLGAGVVGAALGLRTVLLRGNHFSITQIELGALHHVSREQLTAMSGLTLGTSLFSADLPEAERRIIRQPWIANVRIRRQLPHTVSIEVVEREPKIAVELGDVYLADEAGALFKRASGDEASGLALVTGIARGRYLADPSRARAVIRRAIALERAWQQSGRSAPIALHHEGGFDAAAMFTVVFDHHGRKVGARLGTADASTVDRLRRLGSVLDALDAEKATPELVHLEQRSIDRVAVKLADAAPDVSNKPEGGPDSAASGI